MQRKVGSKGESKTKPGWKYMNITCIVIVFTLLPMAILLHISSSVSKGLNSSGFNTDSFNSEKMTTISNKRLQNESLFKSSTNSERIIQNVLPPFFDWKDFTLNFTYSLFLSASNGKEDMVIGMAQDMDPKYFVVFASSLRSVNSHCIIAILMNKKSITPLILEIAARNQINIIIFGVQENSVYSKYHPSTLRWLLIPTLLKSISTIMMKPISVISNPTDISSSSSSSTTATANTTFTQVTTIVSTTPAVLLIDVRDTYFQRDPFSCLTAPARATPFLHAFTGVESITIENCGWNGGWVKDCFGSEMLRKIGGNHIICSGVSLGDLSTIMVYVDTMSALVAGEQPNKAYFPQCERNGVDQGVHNVIVHTNMVPRIKVYSQSEGPVSNMQSKLYDLTSSITAKGDELKEVFTLHSREKVYIAHQYDRNTEFQSYLFKKVGNLT